jgi:hypothetical protein
MIGAATGAGESGRFTGMAVSVGGTAEATDGVESCGDESCGKDGVSEGPVGSAGTVDSTGTSGLFTGIGLLIGIGVGMADVAAGDGMVAGSVATMVGLPVGARRELVAAEVVEAAAGTPEVEKTGCLEAPTIDDRGCEEVGAVVFERLDVLGEFGGLGASPTVAMGSCDCVMRPGCGGCGIEGSTA